MLVEPSVGVGARLLEPFVGMPLYHLEIGPSGGELAGERSRLGMSGIPIGRERLELPRQCRHVGLQVADAVARRLTLAPDPDDLVGVLSSGRITSVSGRDESTASLVEFLGQPDQLAEVSVRNRRPRRTSPFLPATDAELIASSARVLRSCSSWAPSCVSMSR